MPRENMSGKVAVNLGALYDRIRAAADRDDRSVSSFIRRFLQANIDVIDPPEPVHEGEG